MVAEPIVLDGVETIPRSLRVEDVLPDILPVVPLVHWAAWLRARGLSEGTVRLYSYGVFRLFFDCGISDVSQITEDHITAFLQGIGDRSSARTQYMRGIRSFMHWCHRRGLIDADPTVEVTVRKPRRPPRVALEPDELLRYFLAAAWRSPRRAWTLMLVFGLGTRRMEVVAIQPEDVVGDRVFLRDCKYGKQRWVELTPYAKIALEELRPWYNGTVLGGIGRGTITEWAHQAAVDSGLLAKVRHRPAHVLRASFITHLLNNGVPVHVVRDMAGHENIATTNDYAAVFSHQRRTAADGLHF